MEHHFQGKAKGDKLDRNEVKQVLEQLGYYPDDALLDAFLVHLAQKLELNIAPVAEEPQEPVLYALVEEEKPVPAKKGISVTSRPASATARAPHHHASSSSEGLLNPGSSGFLGPERRLAAASVVYDSRTGRVKHDPVRMMSLYKNEWKRDSFLSPRKRLKQKTSYVRPKTPAAVKSRLGYDPVSIYQETKNQEHSRKARTRRHR